MSVKQIKGIHGGTYSRDPAIYEAPDGTWGFTDFIINNMSHQILTLYTNNEEWFHLPTLLRSLGLLSNEFSDITNFGKMIPYHLKRFYSPYGRGVKRTFIKKEALELFELSLDGKPIVKKKYNVQYSGVVSLKVNIEAVEQSFMRIMQKLKNIEDRAVLCDVYRILKQLE